MVNGIAHPAVSPVQPAGRGAVEASGPPLSAPGAPAAPGTVDAWAQRPFSERVKALPRLGLGVSTEYGAIHTGLDPLGLAERHPHWAGFLEVGVEVDKGLDAAALRWRASGRPTTYHFLDVNLDEPDDLDPGWVSEMAGLVEQLGAAWVCGDLGLWHFGVRDRAHMLLLPPVLTAASADAMAAGIRSLRGGVGREVLPENPPGEVFVGDLHLLEYFARVAEAADTGLLCDLAHLAMYQRSRGLDWRAGLDSVPFERVVELHVAGGDLRDHGGYRWVEDTHGGEPLPEVWDLLAVFAERAPNLKAVVFECERNPLDAVLSGFARIERVLSERGWGRS